VMEAVLTGLRRARAAKDDDALVETDRLVDMR
jgi:hypothetical protein